MKTAVAQAVSMVEADKKDEEGPFHLKQHGSQQ
jgi:hypothetical protein